MNDYEIFIIWENARIYEKEILDDINSNFCVKNIVEVKWNPEKFTENLTSFYETDFRLDCQQLNVRGSGAFLLIFVEDNNPKYCAVKTNKGIENVNFNVYRFKDTIRKKYTKNYSFHGSINRSECESNLVKLFGLTIDEFLCAGFEKKFSYEGNCLGVNGWNNVGEIFKVLNASIKYVVLRAFDGIPQKYSMKTNGDIDILVEDLPRVACILQPWIERTNNFRFFNWLNIGDERVLIHPKYVGDYYYDENWEKEILNTRVWNGNIYVPSDEMLFWSLVYHGCFHKDNIEKYDSLLLQLAKQIGVKYILDTDYLSNILATWMRNKGYKCKLHLDAGACRLNTKNIPLDLLDDREEFYIFKSFCCDHNYSTLIVSKELIRSNPQLFSDIVKPLSPIYELNNHKLIHNSALYDELVDRRVQGELLWRYAVRYDNISEFKYTQKEDGCCWFDRNFVTKKDDGYDEIVYSTENRVEYINGALVDDLLKKSYIVKNLKEVEQGVIEFIKSVFDRFSIDDIYLTGTAWDMLSKNCKIAEDGYRFFDLEARTRSDKVKKVDFIAYELDWLSSIGIIMGEAEVIFLNLCKEFNVPEGNYNKIIYDRKECVLSILTSNDEMNYEYSKYIDIPMLCDDRVQTIFNDDYQRVWDSLIIDNALFIDNKFSTEFFLKNNIKNVIVYGLGKYGKRTLDALSMLSVNVVGCVDKKINSYGTYKVVDDISKLPRADLVIVAMRDYRDVIREIRGKGISSVLPIRELIFRMEEIHNEYK